MEKVILLVGVLMSASAGAQCSYSAVTCSLGYGMDSAIANGAWSNSGWLQGLDSSLNSAMSFLGQDIAKMSGSSSSYSYYPSSSYSYSPYGYLNYSPYSYSPYYYIGYSPYSYWGW